MTASTVHGPTLPKVPPARVNPPNARNAIEWILQVSLFHGSTGRPLLPFFLPHAVMGSFDPSTILRALNSPGKLPTGVLEYELQRRDVQQAKHPTCMMY